MRSLSLHSSAIRLKSAMKTLQLKWDQTRESWDDQVSQEFEEQHILPLETQVQAVLIGIDELGEVLRQALQECEPRP